MTGGVVCAAHAGVAHAAARGLPDGARERIAAAVAAGASLSAAIAAAGLGRTQTYDWMRRAEVSPEDPLCAPYAALAADVEAARGRAVVRHVAVIAKAAQEDWRASAWMLERLDPRAFGSASERSAAGEDTDGWEGASEQDVVALFASHAPKRRGA